MRATCREIDPVQPAFENHYPQNYETAEEHGMFVGLNPLGDLDAKTRRTKEALMCGAFSSSTVHQMSLP
ncbi:MAG: hypothetical protein WA863_15350 [Methyloceanibacter sp.]